MSDMHFFISYRRKTDFEAAAHIATELAAIVGNSHVFFDKNDQSLPPGVSWPRKIVDRVIRADVVLAVIGERWLDELRRRNTTPDGLWVPGIVSEDWVRREIGFALQFGIRVVPMLIGQATVPEVSELPDDLAALSATQACDESSLIDIIQAIHHDIDHPGPTALHVRDVPVANEFWKNSDNPEESVGEPWSPAIETDSPHLLDYKCRIGDPRERHRLRVGLLSALVTKSYAHGVTFPDLERAVRLVKYETSSAKNGMFLQASCLVTDGMAGQPISRVLVCIRESYQFHDKDRRDPRNVKGESCLFATCMSSFSFHKHSPHLPNALLNDLSAYNPWAVFSRKLLLPDSVVDCRLLGIGFNLKDSSKEYVHLVWHVRTRTCPQAMLVPAREKVDHDAPYWVTLDELSSFDFEKAPIDRAVVNHVFGRPAATSRDSLSGFVPAPSLDGGTIGAGSPERWARDTVPLDLARMFQFMVHRGRLPITASGSAELLRVFVKYVRTLIFSDEVPVIAEEVEFPTSPPPFTNGIRLTVVDESRDVVGRYLVLAVETVDARLTDQLIGQVRGIADEQDFSTSGVLLLDGVHTSERHTLYGSLSLHDPGTTPIHVVRIAVGSGGVPVKRICHALIPIACGDGLDVDAILVTRTGDERPRLPGGKIEGEESPAQALARELLEELSLEPSEFEITATYPQQTSVEVSPSSSLLTRYQIFPFIVKVRGSGVRKLQRQAFAPEESDGCRIWSVPLSEWLRTGLGFDPTYPRSLISQVTPEVLRYSAVSLSSAHSSSDSTGSSPDKGEPQLTTYTPKPLDTSAVVLPVELRDLLERLAENTHDVWAAQRIKDGWSYGPQRDDATKKHPCLVPYAELPEAEKEYDRNTAAETLKAILLLGFKI